MRTRTRIHLVAALLAGACASPNPVERNDASLVALPGDAAIRDSDEPAPPEPRDAALAQPDPNDASASAAVSGSLGPAFLTDAGNHWLNLIATNWTLAPGHDSYLCVRMTVPHDAYLHEFASLGATGTHHSVLVVNESASVPDGIAPCDVDRSGRQIYDSNDFSAGSEGHLLLPNGVAMQIRAGQQLLLNVHLLNTGAESLMGQSGVWVRTLDEAQVKNLAEIVLAGPELLQIPPGLVTRQAHCTWRQPGTIFGLAPHMHELGTRMKVVAQRATTADTVLIDSLYSFDYQHIYLTDLIEMQAGDRIQVECTYQNANQRTVGFGQTARDEMCFAALNVFPAHDAATVSCSD